MKKLTLLAAALLSLLNASADTIYKHSGEKIECHIASIENGLIKFTYKGETGTHVFSKYAIEKIAYDSGREEIISKKYNPELSHYQDIIITENPNDVEGLKQFEIADPKEATSVRLIKKYAARRGSFIVLIKSDAKTEGLREKRRLRKKAICYTY